jgi:hypothetical protein
MNGPPQAVDGVKIGGLLRCCLETLDGMYSEGPARKATEGQRVQCKYASDSGHGWMVFSDGFWRWDQP